MAKQRESDASPERTKEGLHLIICRVSSETSPKEEKVLTESAKSTSVRKVPTADSDFICAETKGAWKAQTF